MSNKIRIVFHNKFLLILNISTIWEKTEIKETDQRNEDKKEDLELPLFELDTIATVTNNFSVNNKLGEGGFGPVYKVNLLHLVKCLKN